MTTDISPLIPRQPVPDLSVPLVGGGSWSLTQSKPENFTLIVVYRGLHCPICKGYLGELNKLAADFADRGVAILTLSSDEQERAEQAKADWGLDALTVGYGLTLDTARKWGLYVSTGRGKTSIGVDEPERFAEPGLFLVRPDGTLYFATVQTMPFARPRFQDILPALDFVLKNDYPGRGEVVRL